MLVGRAMVNLDEAKILTKFVFTNCKRSQEIRFTKSNLSFTHKFDKEMNEIKVEVESRRDGWGEYFMTWSSDDISTFEQFSKTMFHLRFN